MWQGRGVAWALMSPRVPTSDFVRITRMVRRTLAKAQADGFRRIEASVDCEFENGHRWVKALGFERESLLQKFSPEGRDHIGYVRLA